MKLPIYFLFLTKGNVSLHYFNGRGKGEVIRLLMEDHNIPYTETKYTKELWANAQQLGVEDGLYHFGESECNNIFLLRINQPFLILKCNFIGCPEKTF